MLDGAYTPLEPQGPAAEHVVAFARHDDSGTLLAVAPRLVAGLVGDQPLPLGESAWGQAHLALPPALGAGGYRHLITGDEVEAPGGLLRVADALRDCPVALLWSPLTSGAVA